MKSRFNSVMIFVVALVLITVASLAYAAYSNSQVSRISDEKINLQTEIEKLQANSYDESLVDEDSYQAVFLNDGEIYFGKLVDINDKFYVLEDIFYLQTGDSGESLQSSQSTGTDISLAKLGDELHGPKDQMIIEYGQVLFWENLKDTGNVVEAIKEYKAN